MCGPPPVDAEAEGSPSVQEASLAVSARTSASKHTASKAKAPSGLAASRRKPVDDDEDVLQEALQLAAAEETILQQRAEEACLALHGALVEKTCPCPMGFPMVAFPQTEATIDSCCASCRKPPQMGSAFAACVSTDAKCDACSRIILCAKCLVKDGGV